MDRSELLSKISIFPLLAGSLAEDLLSGNFRSLFKGEGIEFDEVRRYEQGDDVRSIDRNVSARFGSPFVKMYREEREMTVFIILDCSASMFAAAEAPLGLNRFEQALLAAALAAFSAERGGEQVGALFFDKGVSRVFPPRKGRSHIMALVNAALDMRPRDRGSGLGEALSWGERLLKRRSLVLILSDFLCIDWEQELLHLAHRHDVAALGITDPLDWKMPNRGLLRLEDPETGITLPAPTGFASFRSAWADWQERRARLRESLCLRSGAAYTELSTGEEARTVLRRFFRARH